MVFGELRLVILQAFPRTTLSYGRLLAISLPVAHEAASPILLLFSAPLAIFFPFRRQRMPLLRQPNLLGSSIGSLGKGLQVQVLAVRCLISVRSLGKGFLVRVLVVRLGLYSR